MWRNAARSGWGERGLRGPHGVVKSIRPGLEPRLPALLTVVRRERHQRDSEKTWKRCHGGREWRRQGGGPRIKYHPRYVPFENVPSPSFLSRRGSHLPTFTLSLPPTHVRARVRAHTRTVVIQIFNFDLFDAEIAGS